MKRPEGFVVGLDVGARKKGYHGAVLLSGSRRIHSLFHFHTPEHVVRHIRELAAFLRMPLLAVGVDAPRRSRIKGPATREAERELRKRGYRLYWTPRGEAEPSGWMVSGEELWIALEAAFPEARLAETFPTASSDGLHLRDLVLPLSLLAGREKRKYYGDYLDASFCALTAESLNRPFAAKLGAGDELNPIHVLETPVRLYTLCMVVQNDRILLGKKKRGLGLGFWNGFGGKVEEGETLEEAVARELREEAHIEGDGFRKMGLLHFSFENQPVVLEGHIYRVDSFSGEPAPSEEMEPAWFPLDRIPYEQMWADDPFWVPLLLEGRRFRGHFLFDSDEALAGMELETTDQGDSGRFRRVR